MENHNRASADIAVLQTGELLRAFWRKKWQILLCALAGAVLMLMLSLFVVTPQYASSVTFYLDNSAGDSLEGLSSSDLTAARNLVDSCAAILETRVTMQDIIRCGELELEHSRLASMISARAIKETELLEVTVTAADPGQALQIAAAVSQALPQRAAQTIPGVSLLLLDPAELATRPCGPNHTLYALIGCLLGIFASTGAIALGQLLLGRQESQAENQKSC